MNRKWMRAVGPLSVAALVLAAACVRPSAASEDRQAKEIARRFADVRLQGLQQLNRNHPLVHALELSPAVDPVYDLVDWDHVSYAVYGKNQAYALLAPVLSEHRTA